MVLVESLVSQTPGYRGKYATDPTIREVVKELEGVRGEALPLVKERLTLVPREASKIVVSIKDVRPARPETITRYTGAAFETSGPSAEDGRITTTIHPDYLVSRRFDLRQELAHEMVHAVMHDRMAEGDYRGLPKWVREGLAVWCAGQVEERFVSVLVSEKAFREPERVFPGLDREEPGFDRYGEYGMAIMHLSARYGTNAPGKFAGLVIRGLATAGAIREVAGMELPDFVNEVRSLCLKRARSAEPPDYVAFVAIVAADKERQYAKVCDLAAECLACGRDSPLLPDVLYWHGKACRLSKQPECQWRSGSAGYVKHYIFRGSLPPATSWSTCATDVPRSPIGSTDTSGASGVPGGQSAQGRRESRR
jgi:hypothetical protein